MFRVSRIVDNVEQIKSRVNIVDLIREYIEVKKAGANWKALCPFHSEKSPSLMISEDKQIWHCFGCNEGGDVFGFVMKMEGLEFPEALRHLAKKAGVVLQRQDPAASSQKTKLSEILEAATSFYSAELLKNIAAVNYIKQRGLKRETIIQWKIGFSPPDWDGLLKFLERKYSPKDIAMAGLLIEKEKGGFYDRFRGRIMFPIFNHLGSVVGFTARVLPEFDDGKSGKYVNTPETIAYKKSEVIYGLNFARQEIKKAGYAVIVEGNMDAIALHQAGFKNAIAVSGTALTNEQLNILKRYTENLVMSFDADSAGVAAAERGIDLALAHNFNIKVLNMPRDEKGAPLAKDPDELVKKSPDLWKKALISSKEIIQFFIDANILDYNLGNPRENAKFCQIILSQIKKLKSPVERALWIKKLSQITGAEERDLHEIMGKFLPKGPEKLRESGITPTQRGLGNTVEHKFLALLIRDQHFLKKNLSKITPEMITDVEAKEFYKYLTFCYNNSNNEGIKISEFRELFRKMGKNPVFLDKLLLLSDREYSEYDETAREKEVKNLGVYILNNYLKQQRKILGEEMSQAERGADKEKIGQIMQHYRTLEEQSKF